MEEREGGRWGIKKGGRRKAMRERKEEGGRGE